MRYRILQVLQRELEENQNTNDQLIAEKDEGHDRLEQLEQEYAI